ncbi:MAG: hypothetical protein LQ351_002476 [Letrouitia transgressa]|nr:MAG: hypothetical protein LQ351_002476 [Letrouitia transgressa]
MGPLPVEKSEPIGGEFTYQSLASELIHGLRYIKGRTGYAPITTYSYEHESDSVRLHSKMLDGLALILVRCPGEHAAAGIIKAEDPQTHFDISWVRNSTSPEYDDHLLQNILTKITEGSSTLEVILLSVVEHCREKVASRLRKIARTFEVPFTGRGYFSDSDLKDTVDHFFLMSLRGRKLILPGETITQVLNSYIEALARINESTTNQELMRLAMLSRMIHIYKSDLKKIRILQERRIEKVAQYATAIMDLADVLSGHLR